MDTGSSPIHTSLSPPQQPKTEEDDRDTEESIRRCKSKMEQQRNRIITLEADNAALRLKLETKQKLQTSFETQLRNLSMMLDGVTASVTRKKKELTKLTHALADSWNSLETEIKSRSHTGGLGTSPIIAASQSNIDSIVGRIVSEIQTFGMN